MLFEKNAFGKRHESPILKDYLFEDKKKNDRIRLFYQKNANSLCWNLTAFHKRNYLLISFIDFLIMERLQIGFCNIDRRMPHSF